MILLKKIRILLAGIFVMSLILPASSQTAEEQLQAILFQDLPITLATKTDKTVSSAPSTISVLSGDEIRKTGALTYMDALRLLPGVEISLARFGQYEIVIRGIKTNGSEKVLLMIDGHAVNEAFFGGGTTLLDDLTVDNIKQIEVIRGPGSALYGANAFIGIVNIVTLKAKDLNGKQSVILQTGSWNTNKTGVLFGKQTEDMGISGYFEYFDSDGSDEIITSDLQTVFDGLTGSNASLTPGEINFYRERYDAGLNLEKGDFSLNTRYVSRDRGDYIGLVYALNDTSSMDLQQAYVNAKYKQELSDILTLNYDVYYDYFNEDVLFQVFPRGYTNFLGEVFPEGYIYHLFLTNQKTGVDLNTEIKTNRFGNILVGALYEYIDQFNVGIDMNAHPYTGAYLGSVRDVSDTWNWNKELVRKIWALYIQDQFNLTDTVNLTLGIRHDNYDDFGGTTNPRLGFVWKLTEESNLKILYGSAFRAPNFRELYDRNNSSTVGNPDLDPETINSYEISADYKFESLYLNAGLFRNEIEDIIVEGPRPAPNDPSPFINVSGETIIQGVELETKYLLNDRSYTFANYSYQESEDINGGELPDIPAHKGNMGINWGIREMYDLTPTLSIMGPRKRAEGDTRDDLDGFLLLNLNLNIREPLPGLVISLSIINLLDEEYAEPGTPTNPDDYPQPGISYWGKLNLSF